MQMGESLLLHARRCISCALAANGELQSCSCCWLLRIHGPRSRGQRQTHELAKSPAHGVERPKLIHCASSACCSASLPPPLCTAMSSSAGASSAEDAAKTAEQLHAFTESFQAKALHIIYEVIPTKIDSLQAILTKFKASQ